MSRVDLLRALTCAAALGGAVLATAGCEVGVGPAYYPVVDDYYPAGCVATTAPMDYGGYANYWCGNAWYYRGAGGRWAHYDREPPYLYDHRMRSPPMRRTYERATPVVRGGGTGGPRPGPGPGRGGGHRR